MIVNQFLYILTLSISFLLLLLNLQGGPTGGTIGCIVGFENQILIAPILTDVAFDWDSFGWYVYPQSNAAIVVWDFDIKKIETLKRNKVCYYGLI